MTASVHQSVAGNRLAPRWCVFVPLFLGIVLLSCGPALAGQFHIERVADTTTPVPGDIHNFIGFGLPAIENGNVVFASGAGIYLRPAGQPLEAAVTPPYNLPGLSGGVSMIEQQPTVDADGNIAFIASDFTFNNGVFRKMYGSPVDLIANRTTLIPNFPGGGDKTFDNFKGFGAAAIDNGTVAFAGTASNTVGSQQGIYTTSGGALTVIADGDMIIPGLPYPFTLFSSPNIDNGQVVFKGGNGLPVGYYTNQTGSITTLADFINTQLPDGLGTFHLELSPYTVAGISEGEFAFLSVRDGVFGTSGGSEGTIVSVATNTTVPVDEFLNIKEFSTVAFGQGEYAFLAGYVLPSDLYTTLGDGQIRKIIGAGDLLDGRTVGAVGISAFGISDGVVAFHVRFVGGSSGIYLASVPEPSSLVLALIAGACGLVFWRRRRR